MSNAWKRLDLGGDGLQAVNRRLVRDLRRRPVAYALLALFPLGAHRWYLREPVGALAYCALSAAALAWWPAAIAALAFAIFDAWWIDRRVAELNKLMRRRAWLGDRPPPPPGHGERFDREPGA